MIFLQKLIFSQNSNWIVYNTTNSDLTDNTIRTIVIDKKDNKWIGTQNSGLVEFDGTNWTVFNTSNSGLPNNRVFSITIDKNGDKWIGTLNGGLAKFDGTNWTVFNTSNSGLPNDKVLSVKIDTSENKWIGTEGGGVAEFNGTKWTIYNDINSSLPDYGIWAITIDKSGNKWIGTWSNGVAKFDGTNWTVYDTTNSGLSNNTVLTIAIDGNGSKWIGTAHGGLVVYNKNEVLPVELTSFSASIMGQYVCLNWETATESGNYGFEIQRSVFKEKSSRTKGIWEKVGFVKGNGNSISAIKYSFTDKFVSTNKSYSYRLKQINYNGKIIYSNIVNILVKTRRKFKVSQNYPNPFNTTTKIKSDLVSSRKVALTVYNLLGQQIKQLVNRYESAGYHELVFDGSNLSSGVYYYRIKAGQYSAVKKMILVK